MMEEILLWTFGWLFIFCIMVVMIAATAKFVVDMFEWGDE